jgi:UDP-glucose:(glucosyl)LPS alpha-1,2-glucosyltransferase
MVGFEQNEISVNSQGGTEITTKLLGANLPQSLLGEFQIIPSRVRKLHEDKIRIYVIHDMPEDPEISHLKDASSRNRFHKIIFNSNWHLNDAIYKLGIPRNDKIDIIETPIETITHKPKTKDKTRLIYLSTPQRGLDILVPVFEKLAETNPDIHLDVFSSFEIYGWPDMDKKYEPLYKRVREHPQMTYHGFANREEITEALQNAHILAYPCIWKETACRVLMESMSAGLMCVHPNLGALCDTGGMLTLSYQYQDNTNDHASIFHHYLEHAIHTVHKDDTQAYLTNFVKPYADMRFNIKSISTKWEQLLNTMLGQYTTVESRKPQVQMFTYRT